jgi:N utilization substance protein A
VVSRSHPDLVRRLLELEVPELTDGTVEIMSIAREPGHRTKIAVISHDPNVDPKGACVGARGSRVRQVVNELRGEKVDVVQWREDVSQFIAEALGPAKVKEVHIDEEEKTADVIVSEHQLSLAIGKEGQNARLAARLSGYKVDIRSDTEGVEEPETAKADGAETAKAEDGESAEAAGEPVGDVAGKTDAEVAAAVGDEQTEVDVAEQPETSLPEVGQPEDSETDTESE